MARRPERWAIGNTQRSWNAPCNCQSAQPLYLGCVFYPHAFSWSIIFCLYEVRRPDSRCFDWRR
jgi:hypothetical protein